MPEKFRPVSNTPPDTFIAKIIFNIRMVFDLQLLTIVRSAKKALPFYKGEVLDIGCGASPYNYLLNKSQTTYYGIDIVDANKFDYKNSKVIPFNGEDIPFEDNKFDAIICTEVLEHVANYQKLTDEIYRVMKDGATGIVTIPWSARYHYIPWDYFRYTPSALKNIFSKFSHAEIIPRGDDISAIGSKIIVLFSRNLVPVTPLKWILVPLWILCSPIMVLALLASHASLIFNLGSDTDPLGYTIILKK